MLLLLLSLISLLSLGEDSEAVKVMFFGDSTVAGVHNADIEICPFRYHFLRKVSEVSREVYIVGTNSDPEGTCQKIGEGLDGHNNGYRNAGTDELLDYITSDLQFLHSPVDYYITSLGARDCLQFRAGGDYQIVSQSIRRIMGRLLNLNEKSKIVHVPIVLPESAGSEAVECMKFVNEKLHLLYDADKGNERIQVMKLENDIYDIDNFFMIGNPPEVAEEEEVSAGVIEPEVDVTSPVIQPEVETTDGTRRIAEGSLMFLPKWKLAKVIAELLVDVMDFEFRAKTLYPTPEVTKESDYYGYDWCMANYEEGECFEYYYGYAWCLEKYGDDECYNYYFGDLEDEDWGADESYKWCINFYDEEYCSFAYLGEQPDDWDWLSFGYHDCLKTTSDDDCFEQYYGYAWCLNKYDDSECYEYYYGEEDFVWDEDKSYKWCLNFYSDDDCSKKYLSGEMATSPPTGNTMFAVVVFVIVIAALVCVSWKKISCCKPKKQYNRLEQTMGGEDEVGLL